MRQEKCEHCNGFGYTKGAPGKPYEKVDCDPCEGTGKIFRTDKIVEPGHPDHDAMYEGEWPK